MSYKHTSLGRPSQETINQRAIFDRQFQQAQALGALIAVHRIINDELTVFWAHGWSRTINSHVWQLGNEDGRLAAEVSINKQQTGYVATVWHPDGCAECGFIKSSRFNAMRWCEGRLHAASLNARADELRATGAADDSEGDDFDHERYLAELADAKDDHDYSIPF